jgi:hypothetical protein
MRIIAALLLLSTFAFPQEKEEMVSVPKSKLSKQQLAEVEADDLKAKAEQYGKWVGIGKEVGIAVNDGLSAVTTQTNNFAQTPVGKWTIAVIVFKVVGVQVIGLLVGLGMFAVGIPIWLWSYRKFLPHAVLDKETLDKETGKVVSREYKRYDDNEIASSWRIGHWVIFGVFTATALGIMFGTWA